MACSPESMACSPESMACSPELVACSPELVTCSPGFLAYSPGSLAYSPGSSGLQPIGDGGSADCSNFPATIEGSGGANTSQDRARSGKIARQSEVAPEVSMCH